MLICYLFPLNSDGDFFGPIYGRASAPPQGYGNARELTSHLVNPTGGVGTSPQTGRHRESIPGPPDLRTDAPPTALATPLYAMYIVCVSDRFSN